LRVLAEDASLRLPETTLGIVPDLTGTSTLVEAVGYSRALEICLTGRAVGAAEAQAIGLANVVVPAAELDATVADLVAALTAPPVAASRATAALVRSAVRNEPAVQDAAERAAQVRRLQELVGGR
ncbi:MAG TPA: enoyl-CoA hydratase/isomerase family protein, partial [Geodermatophilus sp.]|nr:enoyl-CoA hydratase/isomerase family protein [Geodermatophilus sp.]